jgi:hypothetical protein
MKVNSVTAGLILGVVLLAIPVFVSSKGGIYEDILENVKIETGRGDDAIEPIEYSVMEFAVLVYKKDKITLGDVLDAVQGDINSLCKKQSALPDKSYATCLRLVSNIKALVEREREIRMFGRDLQAITTGYEIPVDGYPGRLLNFPLQYNGIVNIWQTGKGSIDATQSGTLIRTKKVDAKILDPFIKTLQKKINNIVNADQKTAAIWRYQHGLRFINGDRSPPYPNVPVIPFHKESDPADPDNGDSTERTYLYKRWPDIEDALEAIWDELKKDCDKIEKFNPPLKEDEIVLFTFADIYPYLLWATIDGTCLNNGDQPNGDIGLQWQIATEPVLPNLLGPDDTNPILGGRYPPDPARQEGSDRVPLDGLGLCAHTFSGFGYMCKERSKALSGVICQNNIAQDPDEIILAKCERGDAEEITIAGPDICKNIDWLFDFQPGAGNPKICYPGNTANYINTIGNSMCYAGQCIEQSLELHRIVSGRQPFTAMGEAYPFDPLIKEQKLSGIFAMPSPQTLGTLPRYTPERIVKMLDTALCQKNGLPPLTPPTLCMFNARKRLDFPLLTFAQITNNLLLQENESTKSIFDLQNLGTGIGTRIGTALYEGYLKVSVRSLADTIRIANDFLTAIQTVEFPDQMCPLGVRDP